MHIAGYLAAVLIGVSLGLIGGGGSILTVPVLVYLFGINPLLSTSYSLFVVGSTSLVGAFNNYRKGLVSIKTAFLFGLSSITTVFLTRKFIIPAIPKNIAEIGGFTITESIFTMVLFAILMVIASISMIRNGSIKENVINNKKINLAKLLVYGTAIGFVTGLLGAGGGFLLIPTLVLLVKLPMKEAVGTSLLIIALNSLIGFTGDLGHFSMDWKFLLTITAIAVVGIFSGGVLAKKIPGEKLKKGFGWFVLLMGLYIIGKEIFFR
ncbi:MAG TPA: sulfite exporter TauE/SafE family protein [Panacibacter sp.]|nr:sulfite exporter TauE/SafE family protein [Panacibacter sp.]